MACLVMISKEEFENYINRDMKKINGGIGYYWKGKKKEFMSAMVLGSYRNDMFFIDLKREIFESLDGSEDDVFLVRWEVAYYIYKDFELFAHYIRIINEEKGIDEFKVFYQKRMVFPPISHIFSIFST